MSLNQLNFGHSVKVTIISPITGNLLTLTNVTDFESKQATEKITSKPLNAPPIFAHPPNGWEGTITFDRVDNSIDAFAAQQEAAYWANAQTFSGQIYEYITELNGSISTYRYDGVALTLDDAGKKTSQAKITLKMHFQAAQRVQVQ